MAHQQSAREYTWTLGALVLTLSLVGLAGCGGGDETEAEGAPIATVNGQPVTRAEFEESIPLASRFVAFNRLIERRLLEAAATEAGIVVTDQDIDNEITLRYGSLEALPHIAHDEGLTPEEKRRDVGTELIMVKLATRTVPEMTAEQIEQHFEENQERFVEELSKPANAALWVIRLASKDKADEVIVKLRLDEDVEKVATQYSTVEGPTAPMLITESTSPSDLWAPVSKAKAGDVIGPLLLARPADGQEPGEDWYVFKVEAFDPGEAASLDDPRVYSVVERDAILNAAQAETFNDVMVRLHEEASVEVLDPAFRQFTGAPEAPEEAGVPLAPEAGGEGTIPPLAPEAEAEEEAQPTE